MVTVFKKTMRPILAINKIVGIIHFSYTLEPNGLLTQNMDYIYLFLELTRMSVMLISTAYIYHRSSSFILPLLLLKYWYYVIAARLSVKWMVKYDINKYFNI